LARWTRLAVCVDNADNIADLAAAAEAFGATIEVLVEIDVGGGRCGVAPGEPARVLAEQVAKARNLRFGGLQAYHGLAQQIRDYGQRREAARRAAAMTAETVNLLSRAGFACETVTGGGTGTLLHDIEAGVLTELQPGSYVFMDVDYGLNLDQTGACDMRFENSLFVLTTVMSKTRPDRAVVDAGLKALAFDSGPPRVHGRDDVRYASPSDEHGELGRSGLRRSPSADPRTLRPNSEPSRLVRGRARRPGRTDLAGGRPRGFSLDCPPSGCWVVKPSGSASQSPASMHRAALGSLRL
jgi:3-hydroxy-D-aspartate aldolase